MLASTLSALNLLETLSSFCRAMLASSAALAVMRCLCVCVRLSRSYILSKRINISSSHSSFLYQTASQYSYGNLPNRGVECRWGMHKSRFWANIWLYWWRKTMTKCMTRSLDVTPKTTEQHLIVRSDKSVAYVTNNKRLRSTFCTVEANRHEASRGLFVTAEQVLLV